MAAADAADRGTIAAAVTAMRQSLVDSITAKCDYLFQTPLHAIGAYCADQGGSDERAREILAAVLREVDAAVVFFPRS